MASYVNSDIKVYAWDSYTSTIASDSINITGGNTIVVVTLAVDPEYGTNPPTVTSITDTASNTYTRCGPIDQVDTWINCEMWVATNVTGNSSNIVTANLSGNGGSRKIAVIQYSGLATSDVYDTTAYNSWGATGSIDWSAVTTHDYLTTDQTMYDKEVIVTVYFPWDTGQTVSTSSPSTVEYQESGIAIVDKFVTTYGTYTSNPVTTSVANQLQGITRTFRQSDSIRNFGFISSTSYDLEASTTTMESPAFKYQAGDTIIIFVKATDPAYGGAPPTVSGISDTAGNTYTRRGSIEYTSSHNQSGECWSTYTSAGNSANEVTVTWTGSTIHTRLGVLVYSNLQSSSYDVSASGLLEGSTSTSHTTNTTATTTSAKETIIGVFFNFDAAYPMTASDPYYVRRTVDSTHLVDRRVTSTGTYSITATSESANQNWSFVRAFKEQSLLPGNQFLIF